jgi:hypothetical protein
VVYEGAGWRIEHVPLVFLLVIFAFHQFGVFLLFQFSFAEAWLLAQLELLAILTFESNMTFIIASERHVIERAHDS